MKAPLAQRRSGPDYVLFAVVACVLLAAGIKKNYSRCGFSQIPTCPELSVGNDLVQLLPAAITD